jgi:hypothetical protein
MPKNLKKIVAVVALTVGISVVVPMTTANVANAKTTVVKTPLSKDFGW